MAERLEGKVAIITGAGSGIGKATAINQTNSSGPVRCGFKRATPPVLTVRVVKERQDVYRTLPSFER